MQRIRILVEIEDSSSVFLGCNDDDVAASYIYQEWLTPLLYVLLGGAQILRLEVESEEGNWLPWGPI